MLGSDAVVCSINLGEVLYAFARSHGFDDALDRVSSIRDLTRVEDPDWPLVEAAARLKVGGGMSFADAFCVATAERHDVPVATGDPEIIGLRELVEVIDLRALR